MKITLMQNYLDKSYRLGEIEQELALLDKKLKTPLRTVDDIIRHIELIKERNSLINY